MAKNITKICKICNKEAEVIARQCAGYIEGAFFDIYNCDNCDIHFVDATNFTTDIYQLIYKNPDKVPGYNRYAYYMEAVAKQSDPWTFLSNSEPMYWAVKRALSQHSIDKNAAILEVGSGLGYLTYAMMQAGYNIKGMDISENAVRESKEKFGDHYIAGDIFKIYESNINSYDVIILTEVIEHLEDPLPFMACLIKMLKKDGKLIITTPNKTVDNQELPWNTDLPPVHLWWFSEKSASVIAEKLSCKAGFIDFTQFNKRHFDKMRFKIYKSYTYTPTFDASGQLKRPQVFRTPEKTPKTQLLKFIAGLSIYEPFNILLTRRAYPANKSSTLAFTLTPNP